MSGKSIDGKRDRRRPRGGERPTRNGGVPRTPRGLVISSRSLSLSPPHPRLAPSPSARCLNGQPRLSRRRLVRSISLRRPQGLLGCSSFDCCPAVLTKSRLVQSPERLTSLAPSRRGHFTQPASSCGPAFRPSAAASSSPRCRAACLRRPEAGHTPRAATGTPPTPALTSGVPPARAGRPTSRGRTLRACATASVISPSRCFPQTVTRMRMRSRCSKKKKEKPRHLARLRATVWASRTAASCGTALCSSESRSVDAHVVHAASSSPDRVRSCWTHPEKLCDPQGAPRGLTLPPRRCKPRFPSPINRAGPPFVPLPAVFTQVRAVRQPIAREDRLARLVGQHRACGSASPSPWVERAAHDCRAPGDSRTTNVTSPSRGSVGGHPRVENPRRLRLGITSSAASPSDTSSAKSWSPSTTARPGLLSPTRTASCCVAGGRLATRARRPHITIEFHVRARVRAP